MNKNNNKNNDYELRYLVYCRKSSEDSKERQAQSIESQLNELNELAKRERLKIVKVYTEEKSAHTTGREVFAKMIEAIQCGEGNAILTWHANRLTRNMTDGAVIVSLMDSGAVKEIKTPGRIYYGDQSIDKFVIVLEFGLSKKDSDDKSEVVKRGLKTKCEKGSMPGVAPMGYMNTPHLPGGSRYIIKDPERFDQIKEAWRLMASGEYSVLDIYRIMNNDWGFRTRRFKKQGGRILHISRLYKMFRDPFYYGYFEYPKGSGKMYKGTHEPMISEETFQRVQKILNRNTKTRSKTKEFPFTGIMRCGECGAQITAEDKWKYNKSGKAHNYIYYHCTKRRNPSCNQKLITRDALEAQILNYLSHIEVPASFQKWAKKYLKILYNQELESLEKIKHSNKSTYEQITTSLSNLLAFKISPANSDGSLLSDEAYKEQRDKLEKQKAALIMEEEDFSRVFGNGIMKSESDFDFALYAIEHFKNGTISDKRTILRELGYNHLLTNKKLDITLKETYRLISDDMDSINQESVWLEPQENEVLQRKTDDFTSASPALLRGRDSNARSSGYEPDEIDQTSPPR